MKALKWFCLYLFLASWTIILFAFYNAFQTLKLWEKASRGVCVFLLLGELLILICLYYNDYENRN